MLPGRSQTAADISNMALIRDVFNAERKETDAALLAGPLQGPFARSARIGAGPVPDPDGGLS
jgi:hypothetical protein